MATRIQLRGDTSTNWLDVNPTLAEREFAIETDTGKYKIGDGTSGWGALPYRGLSGTSGTSGTSSNDLVTDITYSNLRTAIDEGDLVPFNYYRITDYKTCYDQPDFNYVGNAILVGNYKDDAPVEPIIVMAMTNSTLAEEAYQPAYPKDRIRYDVSFNVTERLGEPAYGRITERIDEFNNRTDYDHRQILFKRYRHYEIQFGNPYQGTVQVNVVSSTEMTVLGTGTTFTNLTEGNKIGFGNDNDYRVYEISNITSDTEMTVLGLSNVSLSSGTKMYPTDWAEYSSYCQNNVDGLAGPSGPVFEEYYTFEGTDNFNNYIGNYANLFQSNENNFILANNVFHSRFEGNKFGDNCYNNTFFDDCTNNHIGNHFYNNITDDDFDENVIGNYFYDNKITAEFYDNRIGENFYGNYIVQMAGFSNEFYRNNIMNDFRENLIQGDFQNNEVGSQFNRNKIYADFYKNDIGNGYNYNNAYSEVSGNFIGNGFANNNIYSGFYDNQIGEYFNDNQIGDSGNKSLREFDKNSIADNFEENQILSSFTHNQIGSNFFSNEVNGVFLRNVIGYGFQDNTVGYDFSDNRIGNYFNLNLVGDGFANNSIGNGFESNDTSYGFSDNQIGNQFDNNTFGDTQYFTWNDTSIENLSERAYDTFTNALEVSIGQSDLDADETILNKELIMHDTVNDEYHKVKFTQWTLGSNGGGFSYERTKVHPTVEATVYFTKTNYGSEVDVIVPGSLEITRGNGSGIYNVAEEASWAESSPQGTVWNSIFTQPDVGQGFEHNSIGNQFKGNYIKKYFAGNQIASFISGNEFLGDVYENRIGDYTFGNDFLGTVISNTWGVSFNTNTIQSIFSNNVIGFGFSGNTVGTSFQFNQIGNEFTNNIVGDGFGFGTSGPSGPAHAGNKIGNNFHDNTIGEYFYNNTIADNFGNNDIADYFQWNIVNADIVDNDFRQYLGLIANTSYGWNGLTSLPDDFYTGVSGSNTVGNGVGATFNITVLGGQVTAVSTANPGNLYNENDVITIFGNAVGGTVGTDDITVTVTEINSAPHVYGDYTCQLFKVAGGGTGLSYYNDEFNLVIDDINSF